MNFFQIILKQMRQRSLSTWLTMLSVLLGVGLAISILILHREGQNLFAFCRDRSRPDRPSHRLDDPHRVPSLLPSDPRIDPERVGRQGAIRGHDSWESARFGDLLRLRGRYWGCG